MKLSLNHQFLSTEKISDTIDVSDFSLTSIGFLINHQNQLQSSIGLYFIQTSSEDYCLLLSNDKNLARKLSVNPSPDIYTQDLFPIDYNQVTIKDIISNDKEEVTFIKSEHDNYYFMIAKGHDATDTIRLIDMYKKKSYAMQKAWTKRRQGV